MFLAPEFKNVLLMILFLVIVNAIFLYFVYSFYKKETMMEIKDKSVYLKRAVNIFLVVVVFLMIISGIGVLSLFSMITLFDQTMITIVFLSAIPICIILYFCFLIYKEYKIIQLNLENNLIFIQANLDAMKKIKKVLFWILLLNISFSIIVGISYLLFFRQFIFQMSDIKMDYNFDGASVFNFILCIAFTIGTDVFEKAVLLHQDKENQNEE